MQDHRPDQAQLSPVPGTGVQEILAEKRDGVEEGHSAEKIEETFQWTTTKEYQELNFKREALTVNPAKACQPLGAVLCALGFEKTLPYVHGSQGCVAYFRTYFNRHFKEPCLRLGLHDRGRGRVRRPEEHVRWPGKRHGPLQAEDDRRQHHLHGRSHRRRPQRLHRQLQEGRLHPSGLSDPFAHTPSFVGSHTTGWDNMFEGIQRYFTLNTMDDKVVGSNGKINLVPGFETYLGNYRVMQAHDEGDGCRLQPALRPHRGAGYPGRWRIPHVRRAAPASTRCRMRPTPSHPSAATGQLERPRNSSRTPGSMTSQAQHPDGSRVDRRLPDEGLRSHRQAHPRLAGTRSAAAWSI
jgi:hypothetical protein